MKIAKRYLAVVLSFALFLALPLAFTQEAAAASKGTKIAQPSLRVKTVTNAAGETDTYMTAYFYNNKGLNSQEVYKDGSSTAYVYNNSGYVTSEAGLDKDGKPLDQTIYDVKKGKIKGISYYDIEDAKVELMGCSKVSYKNGKVSQVVYSNGDATASSITTYTYKKGVLAKAVETSTNELYDIQTVEQFDKYGNITSQTSVTKWKNSNYSITRTSIYKNSYKNGKLVKTALTCVDTISSDKETRTRSYTGLTVYTYKNGKLVQKVSATSYPENYTDGVPAATYGSTTTYAYTKDGLIKSESCASSTTTATETKVTRYETTAYQYKKVAVNKKCVDAVKKSIENNYSYKSVLPENTYDYFD